jgi:ribosomal protein S12 methylthiotransferase accessory factor
MYDKPRLEQRFCSFDVANLEPGKVLLLSERNSFLLSGHIYQRLIALVDGRRTVDEIVNQLWFSEKFPPTEIYRALMEMERNGYLTEGDVSLPSDLTIFCEHLAIDPHVAADRLQTTKVAIKSFGLDLPTTALKTALESVHLQVAAEAEAAIDIILTDDYLQADLAIFNEKALYRSRPWMLIKPIGTIVYIGPIFVPGKTGCWQCLAQRLRNNRPIERLIEQQGTATPLPLPQATLATTVQTALGMAATEIFKWVVKGENQRLAGQIVTYDALTLETQTHRLFARPQCPACGIAIDAFNAQPTTIRLDRHQKSVTADGGYRSVSYEQTLRNYLPHVSPLTGVVQKLIKQQQPNLNSPIQSYAAIHHFAASTLNDFENCQHNLNGRSAGKGKTDLQAKVSGLCEAIERYSGVFQGDEIRQIDSYDRLADRAIHPNACMNFSQAQYQHRQEWNLAADRFGWFQRVPALFDENRSIEWTPIWSLTHQDFKYLPTAYCYHGYPATQILDCWADSNGCAAGNTIEEAILQGFMELVERDCVALWWYNRLKQPQVDLGSFNDPYFQSLQDYCQTLNRELWVLDITSDLNIPAFAAISRRLDRAEEDIVMGFGAHFDPTIAVGRALTEVNQILPNVLLSHPDGKTQYPLMADLLATEWWRSATVENQPYLRPDPQIIPKRYLDYPQLGNDDLRADVQLCQQTIKQNGMELLVLDLTRPDIGLNVVKVVVPGLRHWWKRLGSGRLYEVPVNMGRLQAPIPESQLNPFPMWM